jgi:hypothetical protein
VSRAGSARRGAVGWIVSSHGEQHAALSLFHWNEPAEPRDELGIGPLRDLLANTFFPGTTTLQRGAKYFLFVPAMYAAIEADTQLRSSPGDSILQLEATLLMRLLDRYEDANRVIGGRFRKVPNTPPSAIYWNGLRAWGIRRFNDSRAHYHAVLRQSSRKLKVERHEEGGEEKRVPWLEVPGSALLLADPRLELTLEEAQFLEDRVRTLSTKVGVPLLRQLLDVGVQPGLGALWDTAPVRSGRADLTEYARDAQRLADAHQGAMLLYNLLCARQFENASAEEYWAGECDAWSATYPGEQWGSWDLDAFWTRVEHLERGRRALERTRGFVTSLAAGFAAMKQPGLRSSRELRNTVVSRERMVKVNRERLSPPHALQGWKSSGVGVERLDFRWRRASRIIYDIQQGRGRATDREATR